MFNIVEMKDMIRIPPEEFNKSLREAVSEELSLKFANKVVLGVGLCICLKEITKLEESHIFPGDGASHTKVYFRYVVFRPFMNQVLLGKVRSLNRDGIYVSLGFFDDIFIPKDYLQQPSRFDEKLRAWYWVFTNEEGETHDLIMEKEDLIRFRILEEAFADTTPTCPEIESMETDSKENVVPYSLTGSVNEPGLGLLEWWG